MIRSHLGYFALLVYMSTLLVACAPNTSTESPQNEQEATASTVQSLDMEWSIQQYGEQTDLPNRTISLAVDGKFFPIDTVPALDIIKPENFADYDIPKEAIIAAGGWWAGLGNYYYSLLHDEQTIIVMQGWQDEMQDDEGFHYEEVRRIVIRK